MLSLFLYNNNTSQMLNTPIKFIQSQDQKYNFKVYAHLKLGEGGFGECFLGIDLKTNQSVAIKIQRNSKEKTYRFQNSILSKLQQNSNLIKSYKVHLSSDTKFYIIMQYCNMGTLKDLMQYYKKQHRIFQSFEINQIMFDILNGYSELIKVGYVHEDIKPSNILIHNNIFKIGDFGLTQKIGEQYTKIKGTKKYIPLQKYKIYLQKVYSSHCSDIYSLGIILFQMIYEVHPYKNKQFEQYCKKKKGGIAYEKNDQKKYYNYEYLQKSKLIKPNISVGRYEEDLLNLVDRMVSHKIKQRPTFEQLFDFFKSKICLRYSYKIKPIMNNKDNEILTDLQDSVIYVSQISNTQECNKIFPIVRSEDFLMFIQKNRFFTYYLDKLINPIKKSFSNIYKLSPYLQIIIKKIALINFQFSKKTQATINQMKKRISNQDSAFLQNHQNKAFIDLVNSDVKEFKQILQKEFEYNLYNNKINIDVDLELTKVADASKRILQMLKHVNEYEEEDLRGIQNLLNFYNIHSIKNNILQMNPQQLYKLNKNSKLTRKELIKKFIKFQISEDLYCS